MWATASKIGLGAAKSVFSPVGITVLSVILIVLVGFNPLFLGFDLIIKSINVLSGNALIQMIIDGAFDADSPVFIIYISVLIASFIVGMFKFFKGSLVDVAASKDFGDRSKKGAATFSGTKLKWVLIWIGMWLMMPFAFGIIMFIIDIFARLFSLTPLSITTLFNYTTNDWNDSLLAIKNSIVNSQNQIDDILNTFFPENVDNVTSLPTFLFNSEVKLEDWKKFLTELATNEYGIKFKEVLSTTNIKLGNLLELDIFDYIGSKVDSVLQLNKDQTKDLIIQFSKEANALSEFITENKLITNNLAIAFQSIAEKLEFNESTIKVLLNQTNSLGNFFNGIGTRIIETYNTSKLPAIVDFGIDGQKTVENNLTYEPEPITISIASSLYQKPVGSYMMSITSNDAINIPIIGAIINLVSSVTTILSDPLTLFSLVIGTFGFAFCFTGFFSLLLMFGARAVDFFSMLCTCPFACVSGINDGGEKFGVWWKTMFGKALIVLIVSMSIAIFGVVMQIAAKFINNDTVIESVKLGSATFSTILLQFLIMVIVIGGTNGMLEFIGWSSQMLNFDNKVSKYRNQWTSKKMQFVKNVSESSPSSSKKSTAKAGGSTNK